MAENGNEVPRISDELLDRAIEFQEEFLRRYEERFDENPTIDLIIWSIMLELKDRREKDGTCKSRS